nr:cation:proton antiporter [Ktedonobacteraceae bacterium]
LLNDATAIVAYRVAVAAVVSGAFSLADAGIQFLISSIGGVVAGIALGLVVTPLFRRLREDVPVYLTLTFLSGYGAYILADGLHLSGVLAVVALGLFYGQPRFNSMTPELRIQGTPLWDIVVFVLNGLIFLLVGLQLPSIVARLPRGATLDLIENALVICLALILVRILWVFPGTYLPRVPAVVRARDPFPSWQGTVIVGWAGMRGGVSLATALALPYVTDTKADFPQRAEIVFVTFVVILITLIVQGLTLPLLIQRLKVVDDGGALKEENKARLKAAQAAQTRLQELAQEEHTPPVLIEKLKHQYEARIKRYSARYHGELDEEEEEHFSRFGQLEQDLLQVELNALVKLRNDEIINDEVMRRVQHDLDLEWLRLQDD